MQNESGAKNAIEKSAYAKINLGLDITGRRSDGYHTVRMVMQSLSLCDTVRIAANSQGGGDARISMTCEWDIGDGSDCTDNRSERTADFPLDGRNLCIKAAKCMADAFRITSDIQISLTKRIPMAAGLAGGSADAAAVMRGLRDLCEISADDTKLMELSLPLGADIPYCIFAQGEAERAMGQGGTPNRGTTTALAEGIGEELTTDEAHKLPPTYVLLVKPNFPLSTAAIYGAYDKADGENGENSAAQTAKTRDSDAIRHPDITGLYEAVKDCAAPQYIKIAEKMGNVLAEVAEKQHPAIAELRAELIKNGADAAMMSGSGPTVFGLFQDKSIMEECSARLLGRGDLEAVIMTETI